MLTLKNTHRTLIKVNYQSTTVTILYDFDKDIMPLHYIHKK